MSMDFGPSAESEKTETRGRKSGNFFKCQNIWRNFVYDTLRAEKHFYFQCRA